MGLFSTTTVGEIFPFLFFFLFFFKLFIGVILIKKLIHSLCYDKRVAKSCMVSETAVWLMVLGISVTSLSWITLSIPGHTVIVPQVGTVLSVVRSYLQMGKLRLCLHYKTACTTENYPASSGSRKLEMKYLCSGRRKHVFEMLIYLEHLHPGEAPCWSE